MTHDLPQPFVVLATQNPVEFEGTYPLPEAQVDRFLLKLRLGYPTAEEEMVTLTRLQGAIRVAEAPWWRRWWPGSGVGSERAKTAFGILALALGCGAAVALAASPRRRFRLAARWVALRSARRPYAEGLCLRFAWLYARWARRTDAPEGLTVRQFVAAVERRRGAPFPALRAWAVAYERVRYGGGEPDPAERTALERHWRHLIDRWPF